MYLLEVVVCKDTMLKVIGLVQFILQVISIIVPIVMILLGTIDLFKAVTAGKDEEIKKRQKALITRLIAGVLVFLVPSIVTLIMSLIGKGSTAEGDNFGYCWQHADDSWNELFKVD